MTRPACDCTCLYPSSILTMRTFHAFWNSNETLLASYHDLKRWVGVGPFRYSNFASKFARTRNQHAALRAKTTRICKDPLSIQCFSCHGDQYGFRCVTLLEVKGNVYVSRKFNSSSGNPTQLSSQNISISLNWRVFSHYTNEDLSLDTQLISLPQCSIGLCVKHKRSC